MLRNAAFPEHTGADGIVFQKNFCILKQNVPLHTGSLPWMPVVMGFTVALYE